MGRRRRGDKPKRLDCAIWGRLGLDACLRTGTYFFSAGITQDQSTRLPAKLLLFGFGVFIVVMSVYVANLAVFLTRVGTIEEAETCSIYAVRGMAHSTRTCGRPFVLDL